MSSGAAPAITAVAEASLGSTIEVNVGGRWDAVALLKRLVSFHSFLVQQTSERWVVHARTPGCYGASLDDALDVIDEWQARRASSPRYASPAIPNGDQKGEKGDNGGRKGGSDATRSNRRAPERGNVGPSRRAHRQRPDVRSRRPRLRKAQRLPVSERGRIRVRGPSGPEARR